MGDYVVPTYGSPEALLGKLSRMAPVCVDVFSEFGMTLNFKPGKSEAFIQWRGHGSQQLRRNLTVELDNLIECKMVASEQVLLGVVQVYRHIGTKTVAAANIFAEVRDRIASRREELQRLFTYLAREKATSGRGMYFVEGIVSIMHLRKLDGQRFQAALPLHIEGIQGGTRRRGCRTSRQQT